MDAIDFGYSMKNIPLPSKETYIYKLIEKTEMFVKRMRWKAFFFDKEDDNNSQNNNYIYKTRKCPPQIQELKEFESDLFKMIENIEFRTASNEFLNILRDDIKRINNSNKICLSQQDPKFL